MIVDRLLQIIDYKDINKSKFYKETGLSNGFLDKVKDIGGSKIEDILNTYPEINPEWLVLGKGEMLRERGEELFKGLKQKRNNILNELVTAKPVEDTSEGIPLIPIEAMAGYGGGEMQIMEFESERFVVPTFKGADFLIQVKGSSMYPKYNSGDIVACKKLQLNDLFFQWNKVYVLDTEQGALIKRIDIASDDDHVMIVSDNEKYRPFPLHKSKINAISIVMGVIRLE
jgi:repressor LexA